MGPRSATGSGEPAPTGARSAEAGSRFERPTAAQILLFAVWIGLSAGLLDLGLFVAKKRLIDDDFYRLGDGFPWIIPAGVASLVLLASAPVALVARMRKRGVPLWIAAAMPSFVGFLDLCAKLPLALWASLLLSGGLAVQLARVVRPRSRAIFRLAAITTPLLAATVVFLAIFTTGFRVWKEHREAVALPAPPRAAPNVLLIVWDTVRARNLSAYGYARPTTPNLERLAARGVRFAHAFATSPWTLPSHASLFTGRWPHELSAGWKSPLDSRDPTLADRLRAIGYDTAGFVANLDYCGRETGLCRGFVHYDDYPLDLREVVTRYVGLGRRVDPFSLAMAAEVLRPRRSARHAPSCRSRKSTPGLRPTWIAHFCTGSTGNRHDAARFSPS